VSFPPERPAPARPFEKRGHPAAAVEQQRFGRATTRRQAGGGQSELPCASAGRPCRGDLLRGGRVNDALRSAGSPTRSGVRIASWLEARGSPRGSRCSIAALGRRAGGGPRTARTFFVQLRQIDQRPSWRAHHQAAALRSWGDVRQGLRLGQGIGVAVGPLAVGRGPAAAIMPRHRIRRRRVPSCSRRLRGWPGRDPCVWRGRAEDGEPRKVPRTETNPRGGSVDVNALGQLGGRRSSAHDPKTYQRRLAAIWLGRVKTSSDGHGEI